MLAVRASLLAVFALIGCALAIDLARAQGPTAETGTTLHPGVNLVGWVGEATPVSQLFNEIPQLESIWAWDAELRDWIVAGRGAPEWLGGLGRVTAGMGLRMHLGGNEPFDWRRSTEPTRGLVKLRTGWNLAAWSGADQTPIDDALKGIGWSLRAVHRWNPTTQQWSIWASPERTAQLIAASSTDRETDDSETPAIRRGEALWINVARAVNWLQPTGILPRLVFPGGASDELQARVRGDLQATLAFYRDQYGIQADPDFTVYIPKNIDALIAALEADGSSHSAVWVRARYTHVAEGWGGASSVMLSQRWWMEDERSARYTLTHEYTHTLQQQIGTATAAEWLVEGTAEWTADEHRALDQEQRLDDVGGYRELRITSETPTLRRTERGDAQWQYVLGWLATDRLFAQQSTDSWLEFWRRLTPTKIGPHGQWTSTLNWRTALQQVSGQTASEFYAVFDAWQREQAAANAGSPSSYEYDGNWIRGRVTGEGGGPVTGVFVNAIRVEGETSVGWNQRAETDADGSFAVRAPEDGDYRLSVDINDNCRHYYSGGRLIDGGTGVRVAPIKVSQSDVSGIDIRLPSNVCVWQIRGRIVGPDGEPLAGILVLACPTDGRQCNLSASAADGAFAVVVDEPGEYHISADLGNSCQAFFRSGVATTNSNSASLITVADEHVSGILVQVPPNACAHKIRGSITQPDGRPLAGSRVTACLEVDGSCMERVWRDTDVAGVFTVTVPTEGEYSLRFEFGGCSLYFHTGGFTTNWQKRSTVRVEGPVVRLNPRQIPAEMCARRISGRVLKADGAPWANGWMNAHEPLTGEGFGVGTDASGRFEIVRVPSDSAYYFSIQLRESPICWYRPTGQALGSRNNPVRVSGADVTSVVLRLPGTVEELCE